MKNSYLDIIKLQSQFCTDMMLRLNDEIQKSGEGLWAKMENHTRKQNDIVRLRRELRDLFLMLDTWRGK